MNILGNQMTGKHGSMELHSPQLHQRRGLISLQLHISLCAPLFLIVTIHSGIVG